MRQVKSAVVKVANAAKPTKVTLPSKFTLLTLKKPSPPLGSEGFFV